MTLDFEPSDIHARCVRKAAKPLALFLDDALTFCIGKGYVAQCNGILKRDGHNQKNPNMPVTELVALDFSDLLRLADQCFYIGHNKDNSGQPTHVDPWKVEFRKLFGIPKDSTHEHRLGKKIVTEISLVRDARNDISHIGAGDEIDEVELRSYLVKLHDFFGVRLLDVARANTSVFSDATREHLTRYTETVDGYLRNLNFGTSNVDVTESSSVQVDTAEAAPEQAESVEPSSNVATVTDTPTETPTQEAIDEVADMPDAEEASTIQLESSEIVVEVMDAQQHKSASAYNATPNATFSTAPNAAHISAPFPSAVQQRVRIPSRLVNSRVIIGLVGIAVLIVVGIMMFSSTSVLTSVPKNCVGVVLLDTIPASKYEYISTLIKNHVGAAERIQVAYVGKNGRNVEIEETDTEPSSLLAVVSKLNSPGAMLDRFEYRRRFDAIYEVIQKAISQEQAPTMMIVGSIGDFTAEERGKLQRREADLYPQKGMSAWWVSNKVAPPTFVYWTPPTRSDSALFVNFPDKSGEMKPVVEILK